MSWSSDQASTLCEAATVLLPDLRHGAICWILLHCSLPTIGSHPAGTPVYQSTCLPTYHLTNGGKPVIRILSGDEAVARGAWEAGVAVASAYPGTPSTEILEELARFPNVYAEWATNEKVALDVAIGAAYAGRRALAGFETGRNGRRHQGPVDLVR